MFYHNTHSLRDDKDFHQFPSSHIWYHLIFLLCFRKVIKHEILYITHNQNTLRVRHKILTSKNLASRYLQLIYIDIKKHLYNDSDSIMRGSKLLMTRLQLAYIVLYDKHEICSTRNFFGSQSERCRWLQKEDWAAVRAVGIWFSVTY